MALPDTLHDWLSAKLDEPFTTTDLAVEASTRSFFRIETRQASFVAMASPPITERNAAFQALTQLFRRYGVATPEVLGADTEHGFFLLEDLGRTRFDTVYPRLDSPDANVDRETLIDRALETIHRIQAIPRRHFETYRDERLHDELVIFDEWLREAHLSMPSGERISDSYAAELIDGIRAVPSRPLHRDFHCRNLIWRDEDIGVVDFQDALDGPITYDLASLLCDCYYTFEEGLIDRYRERFRRRYWSTIDAAVFERAFDYTAIQRQLKACGIFVRLAMRDGRDTHLGHVPSVLRRITARAAKHPPLTSLADSVDVIRLRFADAP